MKRIRDILFFIFLTLLPTQLGKHFWFIESLVLGRRIDYLSPTVYLTDVLLTALVIITLVLYRPRLSLRWIIALVAFSSLQLSIAQTHVLTVWGLLTLVKLVCVGFVVRFKRPTLWEILTPLSMAIIATSVLALFQFMNQQSLGGIWYFLGERSFSLSTPGIAQLISSSRVLLRPYATFSHPNVLGGFLVVFLPWFVLTKATTSWQFYTKRLTLLSIFLGIFLSFSRTSWIAGGIFCVWYVLRFFKTKWTKMIFIAIAGLLLLAEELLVGRFSNLLNLDALSIVERKSLFDAGLTMFLHHPLFGVGLKNFIPLLPVYSSPPYLLQPVHSLYLLIASETGLLGCGLLGVILYRVLKNTTSRFYVFVRWSLVLIGFLGLFDHYFITLVQTQTLLALVLSLGFVF